MVIDEDSKAQVDRIPPIVQGFVEVWNKFEAMLFNELASTLRENEGIYSNYGLFYRMSSNIYPKNDLTMGELSNALSVPLSSATRMVNWMVAAGYIKRLPDPEDRRVVRVALTEKGLNLHRSIKSYVEERVNNILSTLTVEEQVTLLHLIDKVILVLKKASA
jgi:DNA-binding MarR family transcriptional regulator